MLAPVAHSEGSAKSRSRFAAVRGGVFSLYTIPLEYLLGDGYLW